METSQGAQEDRPRYVIVGAGMAGLLVAIRLKQRGEHNFVLYEKGSGVGGTWRDNTYPGLTCDVPAHSYTYSFAHNPDWSAYFAPGPEIRAYFEAMASRFDVLRHVHFNAEVVDASWTGKSWRIVTSDGREDEGQFLIAATGVLHHPRYPNLPGQDDFSGVSFHSARWDHSVDIVGKRVGVIGNGSTGAQIVSALAAPTTRLVQFQRTAQWIMPTVEVVYSDEERAAFRADPSLIHEVRDGPAAVARRARFTSAIIDIDSPALAELQDLVEKNLEDSVADPVLREKLRPDYRVACKRLVYSASYYNAIQQPGVCLETGRIQRIEREGVKMADGTLHELDVLVYATGFKVDRFVRPMAVRGVDGISLDDFWAEGPRAYFAVTVPGFPNMVLLNGPTGPVGNFSLIDIAEKQWAFYEQIIDLVRSGGHVGVAPTIAALDAYEKRRGEAALKTVFASGCQSWYLDAQGRPQVWPWSYDFFVKAMSQPIVADFEFFDADGG